MNGDEQHGFPFWPALLMVLAFNCFLFSQLHFTWRAMDKLDQQKKVNDARIEQGQKQVAAARTWSTILEGVAGDLIELGKTDADIRRVVDKYQIRRNQPAGAAAADNDEKAAVKPAE